MMPWWFVWWSKSVERFVGWTLGNRPPTPTEHAAYVALIDDLNRQRGHQPPP